MLATLHRILRQVTAVIVLLNVMASWCMYGYPRQRASASACVLLSAVVLRIEGNDLYYLSRYCARHAVKPVALDYD